MNLSTRLTGAMVSLVLLTALAVGYLSYRNLEAIIVPAEAARLDARARMQMAVLGCDFAQGFLYGRPVTASELTGLMNR